MFWRNPSAAFFNFLLPLLFLALFGAIFSGDQENLDVIVPGIAGMSVMSTTFTALAMNLTFLREQGVLKRMRGTPLPTRLLPRRASLGNAVDQHGRSRWRSSSLAGKLLFGVGWPQDWVELVVFVVVGVVCFASLGVAFSHVIPNFDAAPAYVNAVFLPVDLHLAASSTTPTTRRPFLQRHRRGAAAQRTSSTGCRGAMVTGAAWRHTSAPGRARAVGRCSGSCFAVRGFRWEQRREPERRHGGRRRAPLDRRRRSGAPRPLLAQQAEDVDVVAARRRGGASARSTPSRRKPSLSSARVRALVVAGWSTRRARSRPQTLEREVQRPAPWTRALAPRAPVARARATCRPSRGGRGGELARPVTPIGPCSRSSIDEVELLAALALVRPAARCTPAARRSLGTGPHENQRVTSGSEAEREQRAAASAAAA